MEWCLDCHRNPAPNLRPLDEIFDVKWRPSPDQKQRGQKLFKQNDIHDARYLTSCTTCHR